MVEYIYRGFKLSYTIEEIKQSPRLFKADGIATFLLNSSVFAAKQFHTEYQTESGAEQEIKKLLEDYVDFELKTFREMQKEHVGN